MFKLIGPPEVYPPEPKARLPKTAGEMYKVLERDRIAVLTVVSVESILFGLWLLMSLVIGFALYAVAGTVVVPDGWAYSVSHIGWWAVIEFVTIWVGVFSNAGYALIAPEEGGRRLQLSLQKADTWLIGHFVCVCIAILSDIAHVVLTGLEFGTCQSTFCQAEWGFLLAFLILLSLQIVFVKLPLLWLIHVYKRRLLSLYEGANKMIELMDVTPGEYAPRLETPLLASRRK